MPFIDVVHDRAVCENFSRMYSKAADFVRQGLSIVRFVQKNYETANRQAKRLCDSTGYDEISLCSLSTSDYTGIDKLIPENVFFGR